MADNFDVLRLFTFIRHADETGISGTGRALDGTVFHTGQVVVGGRSDLQPGNPGFSSLVLYDSWAAFMAIRVTPPSRADGNSSRCRPTG